MPDQPTDPLHYEMKIPPETHHAKDEKSQDRAQSDEDSNKKDTAKDINVVRGDDQPQSVRHSG